MQYITKCTFKNKPLSHVGKQIRNDYWLCFICHCVLEGTPIVSTAEKGMVVGWGMLLRQFANFLPD